MCPKVALRETCGLKLTKDNGQDKQPVRWCREVPVASIHTYFSLVGYALLYIFIIMHAINNIIYITYIFVLFEITNISHDFC